MTELKSQFSANFRASARSRASVVTIAGRPVKRKGTRHRNENRRKSEKKKLVRKNEKHQISQTPPPRIESEKYLF